jgi:hypothetical protein
MDKKIVDILENLDTNIDLSYTYDIQQIKPSDIIGNTTNDVRPDLKDADISTRKHSKIYKTNTPNFDSLMDDNKLKDIDLQEKPRKKNKLKIYFNAFKILLKNIKRQKYNIPDAINSIKNKYNDINISKPYNNNEIKEKIKREINIREIIKRS